MPLVPGGYLRFGLLLQSELFSFNLFHYSGKFNRYPACRGHFCQPAKSTSTCGGTVSTMGTTVSLIGGTVPAQVGLTYGSCTITVDVTSLVAATHLNTIPIGNLKATDPTGTIQVTNTGSATNNLLVNTVVAPALSKSFSNNTPYVGQTVTLSISIKNNDPVYSLTQVSLTDTLPTNVKIANATVTKTNCGSPTVTGSSGNPLAVNDVSATISGATILPGATCEIRVNVTSTIAAAYVNTILANAIQTRQGVTNASAASAPINFQSIGATKNFPLLILKSAWRKKYLYHNSSQPHKHTLYGCALYRSSTGRLIC